MESKYVATGEMIGKAAPRVSERLFAAVPRERLHYLLPIGEIVLLALWTGFFMRPYLDLDPTIIPTGREYLSSIQTHQLWVNWQQCGACAMWNGSERGGAPAFADVYGSMLHPLVILATLGWGVVNGSKLALVGMFFMAGLAQWWLGYTLKLKPDARLWGAGIAVVAGNLAGRMEVGVFGVVLSTAACALVLSALMAVNQRMTRRAAAWLGITFALALVAGQGYMQIGLMLVLPCAVLLIPDDRASRIRVLQSYALAGVVAVLIAAPFLVPYLHFLPEFVKDTDPGFRSAQPFSFVPLNLVINDIPFYLSESLLKLPHPYLYMNYIGWIPLLLAVWGCFGSADAGRRRAVRFFVALSVLALWIASSEPLILLSQFIPFQWVREQIAGIRYPSLIAGLAVPPILSLSAIGLDRLLGMTWPQIGIDLKFRERARHLGFSTHLLMAVPLIVALASAYKFNSAWIRTWSLNPGTNQLLESLRTPDLQWVSPPFGDHFYITSAVAMGLKLNYGFRAWNWRDRALPEPVIEANRDGTPPGMIPRTVVDNVPISTAPPGREYAAVTHANNSRTICTARGIGGDIDVRCDLAHAGTLTVLENSWDGWYAQSDGQPLTLKPGQWLSVDLPPGDHTVRFRYRPWDVPLGLVLCAVGIVLSVWMMLPGTWLGRLKLP